MIQNYRPVIKLTCNEDQEIQFVLKSDKVFSNLSDVARLVEDLAERFSKVNYSVTLTKVLTAQNTPSNGIIPDNKLTGTNPTTIILDDAEVVPTNTK